MMRSSFSDARRLAALSLCSLALVAGTAACSSDSDGAAPTASTGTAPAVDAGEAIERFISPTEPVEVSVGQEFEIVLEADTADCYSWSLDMPATSVLTFTGSRPSLDEAASEEDVSAGSSQDVFVFEAVEAGTVELPYSQTSPCPDSPPKDAMTVTVDVS